MWNMGHDARAVEQRFFHVPMEDTCEVAREADSGVEPRRRRNALANHPTRRIDTGAPRRPASADTGGLPTVSRVAGLVAWARVHTHNESSALRAAPPPPHSAARRPPTCLPAEPPARSEDRSRPRAARP